MKIRFFIYFLKKQMYNQYEMYNKLYIEKEKGMKNKYMGIAKVGEKGQIVIPKEARDMFDIKPGDSVVILCDKKKGMAILKSDIIERTMNVIMPDKK